MNMLRVSSIIILVFMIFFALFLNRGALTKRSFEFKDSWWEYQVIDTMKYSRDPAGEKLSDTSFDKEIEAQVSEIAKTGATHVAVATPYDEQFLPFLKRWVDEARRHNLKVWFRGNFSNWEGWFGYERNMTFDEHINKSVDFIKQNPDLFENGDSFTGCPECENGAQGDPRQTGRVLEYRQFLIKETEETKKAFESTNKKVHTNWLSMNGDVANLIMDKETVAKVGGLISVDHYVKTPQKLNDDINRWAKERGAKIFLGEFGAPIPDIHGNLSEEEQAKWVEESLRLLSQNPNVVGVSYWTNKGGSTQAWNPDNSKRKVVDVLTMFYTPTKISGFVSDGLGYGLDGVEVSLMGKSVKSKNGAFGALVLKDSTLEFSKDGYKSRSVSVIRNSEKQINLDVVLEPDNPSLIYRFRAWLRFLITP